MSPQEVIARYLRRSLVQDSKVAATILRYCPEFAGDEKVDVFLSRIGAGTIRDEVVLGLLEGAKVNGSRPVPSLKVWQRHALADRLDSFAKGLAE